MIAQLHAVGRRFPAFTSSDYRALWLASTASSVSLWAMLMARAWLALEIADTGFAVGLVTFAAMLPWALAPIGGALADRFDRRRVLIVARVAQAVVALALAAIVLGGALTLWQLVLFAAISGLLFAMEAPAEQALLPNTVAPDSLLSAITLTSLARFGSRLVGPLVGAPMLAGVGAGWLFVGGAIFYVLSALLIARVRTRSSGGVETASTRLLPSIAANIREAVAYVGRERHVRMVIGLVMIHCLLTMSFDSLLPILAKKELGGDSGTFGALLMGVGGGALVATLALATVTNERIRGAAFLASAAGSGAAVLVLGLAPGVTMAVVGAALAGGAQATFMALSSAFVQAVVPDAMRGRVLSLYMMLAAGGMALMAMANGAVADVIDVRILLVLPSSLYLVLMLALSLRAADLRRVYRVGGVAPIAETVVPAAAPAG